MQIPYVVLGGQSFFDRREVKDILAFLRLIDSPDDEVSLRRILNVPPRGIGQKARDNLVAYAVENSCSLWKAACTIPGGLGATAKAGLRKLIGVIQNATNVVNENNLVNVAKSVIHEIDYRSEIERQYDTENERDSRWASVEQLVNALGSYVSETAAEGKTPRMGEFIDQLTLGDRDAEEDKDKKLDRNAVILMTVHSAKGLEFPNVYLVGVEEGILPHKKSIEDGLSGIEEERRLCYVGITRAQEKLTISMSLTRMKWGKAKASKPSPFLYEMTGQTEHPNYLRFIHENCI